jgi:Zn-dependent peptidase ImmA (M78 family)/DNA-binding XRE family transcriptional regulator
MSRAVAMPGLPPDPRELAARLREARKAAGFTQDAASAHLGVARTTVVAIEKGERSARPEELIQLAALYRRTVNELLRPGQPASPFAVQLRAAIAKDDVVATEIEAPTWAFQRLCEDYVELERLSGAPMSMNYPPERRYAGAPPEMAGEDLAQRERLRLGIGEGPISNLRLLLEQDVGLRVFYLELPTDVAAMFSYDPQLGGCVAVNSRQPYERRRLSLAHEYGHFLSSRHRADVTILRRYRREPGNERLANTFARCFLMPADGVTRRVNETKATKNGQFTNADILTLAHYFGVSVEAFTRRLEELRLVRSGKWERLKASGFKVAEARRLLGITSGPVVDDHVPPRYRFLALDAYRADKLSEAQLANFLRLDRMQVREMIEASENPSGDSSVKAAADGGRDDGIGLHDER